MSVPEAMTTLALRVPSRAGPAVVGPLLPGPTIAWAALFMNVLAFIGESVLPMPPSAGQALAQGMLVVALILALLANPGMLIRPNLFLTLLTATAVLALMVSIHNEFVMGATYRSLRLLLWVGVLWLLTPWWGRDDLPLLRAHLLCLKGVLATVWIGVLAQPSVLFSAQSRLAGVLWPVPPPQVAHYSAMLFGCTAVLWFCGMARGRGMVITFIASGVGLLSTHTRTALLAMILGLLVAGASLFLGHARVRRTTAVVLLAALVAWTVLSPFIVSWLARGQSIQDLTQLTGRTKVWSAIAAQKRTTMEEIFGTGLGNKSFNGLPIDSNWVATQLELGRLGVAMIIVILLMLMFVAVTRPTGPRRAIALFILAYCVTASFTETGLGDASPYLLELTVAASLLAGPPLLPRQLPTFERSSHVPGSARTEDLRTT